MRDRDWLAFAPVVLRSACAAVLLLACVATQVAAQERPETTARVATIVGRLRAANAQQCAAAAHCGGRIIVSNAGHLNAWSDGRSVAITTRMVRFAEDDDALAFVIAHEMAHNLLGHAASLSGVSSRLGEGQAAAHIRAAEFVADRLAIELVATAGFNPYAAERLFLRLTKRAMRTPASYPSLAQRIAAVRAETASLGDGITQAGSGSPVAR